MSAFLVDHLVPSMRSAALRALCVAFKPSLPLDYVARALGFAHYEDASGGLRDYLNEKKCVVRDNVLMTKESALQSIAK